MPAGQPGRQGRDHDLRARPPEDDPRGRPGCRPGRRLARARERILGTGFLDYLTITLPLASLSNVLTFDEIGLERIADTTLWGHGILRDEGIGGPPEASGAGFMMRNFLVEALDAPRRIGRPRDRRAGVREPAIPCRKAP